MNPIVGRHNALLVASVAGWTLHEGGRDRVCFEETDERFHKRLRFRLMIMEWTGPARQSSPKLFTLSEVSANMLSQRQRGSLSARLTFCSYLKHSVCHSGPLPLPLALSGGPPSGARLPRSIVLRRLRALILSTQSAAILASHQGSFIRRRGPASRTLLPAAIIVPSTLKKKSETNLPRQNPPSRSPFC